MDKDTKKIKELLQIDRGVQTFAPFGAETREEWVLENSEILHRDLGPAVIESDKSLWYQQGRLHREDGPAIEHSNGNFEYWNHGKRHNSQGPAIKMGTHQSYWINGTNLTKSEFNDWQNKHNYSAII